MLTTHFPSNKLMKIAYAIVDKKGRIITFPMEIHIRLFKRKKDAIFWCEEDEKVVKVKIEEVNQR